MFSTGVGRDQKRAKSRVNIALAFTKWPEA